MAITKYKHPTKYASTQDVEMAIKEWGPEVVQCRSWRHPWDPYSALESPGVFCEIQMCSRCAAFRHRMLGAGTGKKLSDWKPSLPKGYSMPTGQGRIAGHTFDQVRLAAMQTVQPKKVESDAAMQAELRSILKGEAL